MKRAIAVLALASFALIAAPPAVKTKAKTEPVPATTTDTTKPETANKVHKTKKHGKKPAGTETPAMPQK